MRDVRQAPRALALLAAGALLAGCGGAPEAAPPPSASLTTRGSTETESAPASDAQPITKLGAQQFVAAYVAALNSAMGSGDLEQVRQLDDGSCQSCDATLTAISKIYRSGGRIEGGSWTADFIGQIKRSRGWVVDVRLTLSPQVVYERDGKSDNYKGGEGLATFIVREIDGEWRVDEWTRAN